MPAPIPPFKRFHQLLQKPLGLCWIWAGSSGRNGYGQFKAFGRMVAAHRFAYELYKGPIPDGMQILHSCDNKVCVNPDHLRIGTHAENMAEAKERGRMRVGANHPNYGKKNTRPGQSNPVVVLGKLYCSQKEAERVLGLGSGTVRWWLLNKPEKAFLAEKDNSHA